MIWVVDPNPRAHNSNSKHMLFRCFSSLCLFVLFLLTVKRKLHTSTFFSATQARFKAPRQKKKIKMRRGWLGESEPEKMNLEGKKLITMGVALMMPVSRAPVCRRGDEAGPHRRNMRVRRESCDVY